MNSSTNAPLKAEFRALETDIHAVKARLIRWIVAGITVATALGFAIGRYVH
jgi:hypothetical protein